MPLADDSCFAQARYDVRLEWGAAGLSALAPADLTIVVDALRFSSTVSRVIASGGSVPLDDAARAVSINGAVVAAAAEGEVVLGCFRNSAAVADYVAARRAARGDRVHVNVIAAGERRGAGVEASLRFAVEDQLASGAIIVALIDRGIDHVSPDAVAAAEAFRALRGGLRHLLSASGSGQELRASGRGDEIALAAELDVDPVVPTLRDGRFTAA